MQNYASLQDADQEESGVLFHVAEPSRARWNHIDDLDSFFARLYRYHQRHGFLCMMVQEFLELVQFVYVICFTIFLVHCVDYPVLFNETKNSTVTGRVTLSDVIYGPKECVDDFGLFTYLALIPAFVVWLWRLFRGVYHMVHFWDIKQFYNVALGVPDSDLDNLTWHEVQTRIRGVQREQQMCIHKRELTELDIYHRILRQHNYLVAMTNKHLIPPRLKVPLVGEVIYWTKGLKYNVLLLLFWGPWAPFENPWHLREEYRKTNGRHELSRQLGRLILWLALANLLFSPLVFLWQILYALFTYAELIKREPGRLAVRNWSLYGRLYLRHFNELEHELQARLSRAHRPSTKYLASFNSPLGAIIARSFAFMCGSVITVFIFLAVYDEDVLKVEHILTLMTGLGVAIAIFKSLIPDETVAYCPESLLNNVLAHTHYLPNNWKGQAHTARIRSEFQQLFQYKIAGLLEELLSPIITPYVLWKHLYPKTLDIVDFFRNFTVSVVGVGDVCSFAQMDVRKHGNPEWHEADNNEGVPDQYTQAEDGKVELSLLHFTVTNPRWVPPPEAAQFVEHVERESSLIYQSGDFKADVVDACDSSLRMDTWNAEGPSNTAANDMSLSTMYLHNRHHLQSGRRPPGPTPIESTPLLTSNRYQ